MGDMNSAINPDVKTLTPADTKLLESETEKKIIVINDKSVQIRVLGRKGDQSNCLDLCR